MMAGVRKRTSAIVCHVVTRNV